MLKGAPTHPAVCAPALPPPPGPLQRLLDPMVVPETLPVHPIRRLQVGWAGLGWQPSQARPSPLPTTLLNTGVHACGPVALPALSLLLCNARRCRRSWCSGAA